MQVREKENKNNQYNDIIINLMLEKDLDDLAGSARNGNFEFHPFKKNFLVFSFFKKLKNFTSLESLLILMAFDY